MSDPETINKAVDEAAGPRKAPPTPPDLPFKREWIGVWPRPDLTAAVRRLTAVLIANADKLDVPFTNAPELSPWTRSVKPALDRVREAAAARGIEMAELRKELADAQEQVTMLTGPHTHQHGRMHPNAPITACPRCTPLVAEIRRLTGELEHARAKQDYAAKVAEWHDAPPGSEIAARTLHEHLGMTWEQYQQWAGPQPTPTATAEQIPDQYMMATRAEHQLGDISRDKPDLAVIYGETEDHYIGHWVAGFGFANVRFPKATTRDLTGEEIAYYRTKDAEVAGRIWAIMPGQGTTGEEADRG